VRPKKNKKKFKKEAGKEKNSPTLSESTKAWISGILMFLVGLIVFLSFFNKAGAAGRIFFSGFKFLIGKSIFLLPALFFLAGVSFLKKQQRGMHLAIWLGIFILVLGASGLLALLEAQELAEGTFQITKEEGGIIGYLIALLLQKAFGFEVALIINSAIIIIGGVILVQFLLPERKKIVSGEERPPSLIRKIISPKFQIKEVPPVTEAPAFPEEKGKIPEVFLKPQAQEGFLAKELKVKPIEKKEEIQYQKPPLELLEADRGKPSSGDIKVNSAIIKKTLQNFAIPVEMSEVNIGPTVTQYTLKPAEGIKLSRITALNNDLALALAAHPIRIEAPIPGRPLVGIEVPNKIRAEVRLRNLISHPVFQNSPADLLLTLGRDVAGNSIFADLNRMPHLLVAGSTGTGKTICLNNLILSLLYRNPPELLKFILIDPKRVEFPVYNQLPHLLTPVIFNVGQTVNTLKWLTQEMERRFDVLSEAKARDIAVYNNAMTEREEPPLPYIVLIIDELADLMAARAREVEAGIVRIAQMARAVGIHLVVATQRPSVEVITGLIKANITSRITFQVASQVDSRTVLDMAGAEKLLGSGDMLYVSSDVAKPKRIQAAYVSEKEVKRVVSWIKKIEQPKEIVPEPLSQSLEKTLTEPEGQIEAFFEGADPLFEEAKRVVTESKKASASLLQRRLRVGYARAARLIDMLEEKGIVGPGEGAKPREVYIEENDQ
jgi:S-DNA-T family DNA segregation ATPase FtsK/SpoIIIE